MAGEELVHADAGEPSDAQRERGRDRALARRNRNASSTSASAGGRWVGRRRVRPERRCEAGDEEDLGQAVQVADRTFT